MKNVIIIPGFSEKNKEQVDSYAAYVEEKGYKTVKVYWPHWESGDSSKFDKHAEVLRIKNIINDVKDGEIVIVAKSVGTLIASEILKTIDKRIVRRVVLVGLPLQWNDERSSEEYQYYEALNELDPAIVTIIQAKNDPYCSYVKVERFVREIMKNKKIEIVGINRDDHEYPVESVKDYLRI
jgi:predicted alpha/beta hydrolase family esterase